MTARHRLTRESSAEPQRILDLARTTLAASGFRVGPAEGDELIAEGPGLRSTRESALRGASRLALRVNSGGMEIEAELGGLRKLSLFILFFPPLLGLLLFASFAVAFAGKDVASPALYSPLFAVAPWLLLAPWMVSRLKRACIAALERLADSLAAA